MRQRIFASIALSAAMVALACGSSQAGQKASQPGPKASAESRKSTSESFEAQIKHLQTQELCETVMGNAPEAEEIEREKQALMEKYTTLSEIGQAFGLGGAAVAVPTLQEMVGNHKIGILRILREDCQKAYKIFPRI